MMSMLAMMPSSPMGAEIVKWLGWTDFGSLSLPAKVMISMVGKYQEFALTSPTDFWICALSLLSLTAVLLLLACRSFERQDVVFGA